MSTNNSTNNEKENYEVYKQLENKIIDSKFSAAGHFNASNRYSEYDKKLGSMIIPVLAIISTPTFIAVSFIDILTLKILIGIISMLSTIILALQKFLAYDEKLKVHKNAANSYLSIRKSLEFLQAKYKDNLTDLKELTLNLEHIMEKYSMIQDATPIIPKVDYEKAKDDIEKKGIYSYQ